MNSSIIHEINPSSFAVALKRQKGLKKLGVHVTLQEYPFEPEHGAYGKGHKHGHDETFEQDYALAQSAYHDHAHSHLKNHPHEH